MVLDSQNVGLTEDVVTAMNLLDQISDALGASGALGDLSSTLGASKSETDSLVGAGLPAILGSLGAQTGGDGLGALMGLLGDDNGGFLDSLGPFFGQGDKTGVASKLVGSLFGSQRGAIESHVANASGGSVSMVSRILPMLAPAVMGMIGKITKDEELDADGLGSRLAAIGADGPLGDILSEGTDEDRAGFLDGIAAFRDAGGLGALVPAAISGAGVGAATKAAAAGGAVATAAGGAAAVTQNIGGGFREDDDRDRTGLGWLPFVALTLGALILGLVLWQCGNFGDDEKADETHSEEVDHSEDETEEEVEEAAAPAPDPTATPEPEPEPTAEPTAEPEAEPTVEPTAVPEPAAVTIADLAVGTDDLSTLVGVATALNLAEPLADPEAGPFTVFAPTNDAFDAAGAVLEGLDETQATQAVSFHVVPGVFKAADLTPGTELTTLSGDTLVIGDDVTLNGSTSVITADIEADNGVVHIIDSVMVPGSLQRGLTTQGLNQLFELEPIQFATSSAEILPDSVPTLDQAIEFLTNVPAGSKFEVQGHTDSRGGAEANQALSEARAASVVAYLTNGGVDAEILESNGYGETQLKFDPEVTDEDLAGNRRIEFVDISS